MCSTVCLVDSTSCFSIGCLLAELMLNARGGTGTERQCGVDASDPCRLLNLASESFRSSSLSSMDLNITSCFLSSFSSAMLLLMYCRFSSTDLGLGEIKDAGTSTNLLPLTVAQSFSE